MGPGLGNKPGLGWEVQGPGMADERVLGEHATTWKVGRWKRSRHNSPLREGVLE
jgi:hypothetical protein